MTEHNEKQVAEQAEDFANTYNAIRNAISQMIVGQEKIIDGVLTCLFIGGHVLLEGVPGLGKTLLVRTLADAVDLQFSRIQFTPDLMPADITGTTIVTERQTAAGQTERDFEFRQGPIFCQVLLADEINRATPKTQSALLEAMAEQSVTVGRDTYAMSQPFFVLATQNPIEQEGTYPLPEAQLDRFTFKLLVENVSREQLHTILDRTTTAKTPNVISVVNAEKLIECQRLVRRVLIAPHVQDYAIRCAMATHPDGDYACKLSRQFVRYGASPRAAQALVLGAKVRALIDGRAHVSIEDIQQVILPALRHRILMNFEGQAEGITSDMVINEITQQVAESQGV